MFSEEEVKALYKPWSKALVVKVLEKPFSFLAMKRRLEFLWARYGHIQVSDMSNSFFLVRFSNDDDYTSAAFGGPWKIYDYYIAVSQWSPSFNEEEEIKSILTWVRLPKLPIQYFNSMAVHRIGNAIGRTVRLDLATSEGSRCRYARICVEIDLTKPLLGKYMIGDRVFYVEYESIENFCYLCGLYGNKAESCLSCKPAVPEVVHSPAKEPAKDTSVEEGQMAEEGDTGSWMVVSRRQKKKSLATKANSQAGKGNKFAAISQVEEGLSGTAGKSAPTPKPAKYQGNKDVVTTTVSSAKEHDGSSNETFINWPTIPRSPLSDITNSKLSGPSVANQIRMQELVVSDNTTSVVQVPITYGNPIFESCVSGTKPTQPKRVSKGKASLTKLPNTQIEKKKAVTEGRLKTKTFKLQGWNQKSGAALVVPQSFIGRPPDPSQ
ncbi:hypothetical protein LINPERHAP1_LOCUS25666 [Linum perenne]